jgi:hypothetical protein
MDATNEITIIPLIPYDGMRHADILHFGGSFKIEGIVVVTIGPDGHVYLEPFDDSVKVWSNSPDTSKCDDFMVQSHWKLVNKGSLILESDPKGFSHFKFRKDSRFGKQVEFKATIRVKK